MRSLLSCICTLAVSSKCKPKAIGASFLVCVGGERNLSEHNDRFVGRTDRHRFEENLSKIILPLDRKAPCCGTYECSPYSQHEPLLWWDIHMKNILESSNSFVCAFKAGCLSVQRVQKQKRRKKISVALLTEHKKKPLQRLNCFTPLHPPTLSFGRKQCCCITWLLSFPPDDFL